MGTPAKRFTQDAGQYLAGKGEDAARTAAINALEADIGVTPPPPKDAARAELEADIGVAPTEPSAPATPGHMTVWPIQRIEGTVQPAPTDDHYLSALLNGVGRGGAGKLGSHISADITSGIDSLAGLIGKGSGEHIAAPNAHPVAGDSAPVYAAGSRNADTQQTIARESDELAAAHPNLNTVGNAIGVLPWMAAATAAAPALGISGAGAGLAGRLTAAGAQTALGGLARNLATSDDLRHEAVPAVLQTPSDFASGMAFAAVPEMLDAARGLPGAVKRAVGNRVKAAADKAAGELELRLGSADLAGKAQKMASAADPEGSALRWRAALGADPKNIASQAAQISDHVSGMNDAADPIRWHQDIASKEPVIRELIAKDGVDTTQTVAAANKSFNDARAQLDRIKQYVGDQGEGASILRKLERETFEPYERHMGEAAQNAYDAHEAAGAAPPAEDGAAAEPGAQVAYAAKTHRLLDQVKRGVQQVIAKQRSGQLGSAAAFSDDLEQNVESPLREHLQDADAWGPSTSAFQKIRNQAWVRDLRLSKGNGRGGYSFETTVPARASEDAYGLKKSGDVANISSLTQNAADPARAQDVQQLRDYTSAESNLHDALTQHLPEDDAFRRAAQSSAAHGRSINRLLDARQQQAGAAADFQAIQQAPKLQETSPGRIKSALMHLVPGGKAAQAVGEFVPSAPERALMLQQADTTLRNAPPEGSPGSDVARQRIAEIAKQQGLLARYADGANAPRPVAGAQLPSIAAMQLPIRATVGSPSDNGALSSLLQQQQPQQNGRAQSDQHALSSLLPSKSRGHESADAARNLFAQDPQAFGPFSQQVADALDGNGAEYGALMSRLSTDPKFAPYQKRLAAMQASGQ
jgi:hypothetical protein